ncbi:LysE family translocator [Brenneria goodwinii]|nr:LysE family translocator [Brenneria goodwinii]MCG8161603.1 LysE family translocator [Brenneria goodwinii]MCG8166050.1 LysE family translocator [Brenneria goodwinii]MCG8169250.1 LysE family translocator [Brenneria goodwinii]MCG8175746.1 LysE family translocator [Brenneria goodwinii]
MLYTAAQTISRDRRSGLMASVGIHLGGYVHVLAAAGLSVLFHAVPILYMTVKLAGALYLVWLGLSLLRTKTPDNGSSTAISAKSGKRAFLESVTIELLNPKTAIFYLAFLPQFIDVSVPLPVWFQFILLGVIVNLTFTLTDIVCVLLARLVVSRLKCSFRVQRITQCAGGFTFIGLGVHLAVQRN